MSTPYGKTQVVQADLQQNELASIDRCVLVVGVAAAAPTKDEFIAINRQSNLDQLLGVADSELKTQLLAKKANASDDWMCYALPYEATAAAGETPAHTDIDALNAAILAAGKLPPVEGIAFCTPRTAKAQVEELAALHTDLADLGRDLWLMFALAGISNAQSWAQYKSAMNEIIGEIEHDALVPVPQLHGNNLGCLLGRLTTANASIADSPLRVETGSVIGLGADPADKDDVVFGSAQMIDLCSIRLNAPQQYVDFPGTYWTGVSTLAAPTSDFAPLENKRIANKAARRLRAAMIPMLGNRKVNNSTGSMAVTAEKLQGVLHSMSLSAYGHQGEIRAPQKGDVVLSWPSRTELAIQYTLRPYNHPNTIVTSIRLDLGNYSV